MRAYLADELDDVELIAGDVGVVELAPVAYLGDDAACVMGYPAIILLGYLGSPRAAFSELTYARARVWAVVLVDLVASLARWVYDGGEEVVVFNRVKRGKCSSIRSIAAQHSAPNRAS